MRHFAAALLGVFSLFPMMVFAEQVEYRCEATDICEHQWWRVISWLDENAKFKPVQRGKDVIEAMSRSPAHKNRLQYRVQRQQQVDNSWVITAHASCRSSIGCPNSKQRLENLVSYLKQAAIKPSANQDELVSTTEVPLLSAIERHQQQEQCIAESKVHLLRHSWAGELYEIECMKLDRDYPEALVVRCRGSQCKTLR